jgi:P27 family predicted phage terminase small subunit
MKGRKPKNLAMKVLTGNPGKRPLASSTEAVPFKAAPLKMPRGLDKFAASEWKRLTASLGQILSPASEGMVLIAAKAYARMKRAEALLEAAGSELYETMGKSGRMVRPHPAVGMIERASAAYHRALAELGASPVAHVRVKKLPTAEQTEATGIRRLLG